MRLTIKKKLLLGAIGPLILLAAVVIAITSTVVTSSMLKEIQNSLRATAISTLAAYEQNSGDYYEAVNGDIWKGNYNISKSDDLVDSIKENAGMDVTFFYGNRRIISSALDENGERILGSPAGDTIVKKVLEGEEEYFSQAVSINGVMNYGYYIPVYQKGTTTNPIGMIFVGANKAEKDAAITAMIRSIIVSVIIVIAIGIGIVLFISGSVTGAIKRSIEYVQELAQGNLSVYVDDKYFQRKDEIGDLSQAIISLRTSFLTMVTRIKENAAELTFQSGNLENMAKNTSSTLQQVESSVNVITERATQQAQDVLTASENVEVLGEVITTTAEQVDKLNNNADIMRSSSEKAEQTIKSLMGINNQVQQAVDTITRQTSNTDASVHQIRQATEIISSIAEETNLLSLNASIEAARAGEAGKGFAVVAEQIQKLAVQSNEASNAIEEIIRKLIEDSSETVTTMTEVQGIIHQQNESMSVTQETVKEVIGGIANSLSSIEVIAASTEDLKNVRSSIKEIVKGLEEMAEENAASTQETRTATGEVASGFRLVGESAEKLKQMADLLADSLGDFKV